MPLLSQETGHVATSNIATTVSNNVTTDDDYVWSSDAIWSQEPIIVQDIVPLVSQETAWSQPIIDDDSESLLLLREEMAKVIPQTYYRPQSSMQKYVDCIMTAMEANVNIPTDDKCKMSKCLYKVMSKQFGLSYVKDLFLSLGSADERNQLIFELQMTRTLYFPEKYISPFANNGSILAEDLIKKRKLPIDYENDGGDEVTYIDKPRFV